MTDRVSPHNLEAECSVLGACLLHGDAIDEAAQVVAPLDFYRHAHQIIFEHILKLRERRSEVDLVTLKASLQDEINAVGGPAYVSALVDGVPRSTNVEHYARIVREKAVLREIIDASTRTIGSAYASDEEAAGVLDQAQSALFNIAVQRSAGGFVTMGDIVTSDVLPALESIAEHKRVVTGIPTGLTDLDADTAGLQPSDLIVVAARPSMGKTSLALGIALHASVIAHKHVGIFSLEMSRQQIGMRAVMVEAQVDGSRLRTGYFSEADYGRISASMTVLSDSRLHIDDSSYVSLHDIRTRARRLQAQVGLDLLLIDYIGLMKGERAENRNLELGAISRGLKGLAKELNVPIVALSQLSRAPETRSDHRPQLSDLRESGNIEQDADVVIFIYRDEVYNTESEDKGVAELIIAKQRNGPTGVARVHFHKPTTRFSNLQHAARS
jgi:replicative DNA helicase